MMKGLITIIAIVSLLQEVSAQELDDKHRALLQQRIYEYASCFQEHTKDREKLSVNEVDNVASSCARTRANLQNALPKKRIADKIDNKVRRKALSPID